MKIFDSYKLGNLTLKNRIVMAPMTRSRAIDNIPNDLMRTYYTQRAGAGLIITEGTSPSPNGLGYPRIPGAYSDKQVAGWKSVAEGVHQAGGLIFVQLMHTGRVTASLNLPKGAKVLAPSAIQCSGKMYTDEEGEQPHDTPAAMSLEEIAQAQDEYVHCTKKLVEAGIDGVELHSANGYLMNQFLDPGSNQRTDNYGGDYKNRARFVLETARKAVAAVGGEKVGIRFSPYGVMNDMKHDYDGLVDLYTYLAEELKEIGVAYIHVVDHTAMGAPDFETDIKSTIKKAFGGVVITGGGVESAEKAEEI
ncbi:MAG: alkene reductase, partial [Cyclobacteriaceae bacterium]